MVVLHALKLERIYVVTMKTRFLKFSVLRLYYISLNIIVISIYRIPVTTNFKVFMYKLVTFKSLDSNNNHLKNIHVTSEFNADLIENSSHHKEKFEFLMLIESYRFKTNFCLPT